MLLIVRLCTDHRQPMRQHIGHPCIIMHQHIGRPRTVHQHIGHRQRMRLHTDHQCTAHQHIGHNLANTLVAVAAELLAVAIEDASRCVVSLNQSGKGWAGRLAFRPYRLEPTNGAIETTDRVISRIIQL
jgi:hypothetical protein